MKTATVTKRARGRKKRKILLALGFPSFGPADTRDLAVQANEIIVVVVIDRDVAVGIGANQCQGEENRHHGWKNE